MQRGFCLHTNTMGVNWISSVVVKAIINDILKKTHNQHLFPESLILWLWIIHTTQWMSTKSLPILHSIYCSFYLGSLNLNYCEIYTLYSALQNPLNTTKNIKLASHEAKWWLISVWNINLLFIVEPLSYWEQWISERGSDSRHSPC